MSALTDMIAGEAVPGHGGCPRVVVNEDGWRLAINQLSAGSWTLLGLWGDTGAVHMATLAEDTREIAVVTIPCPDGRFPSVGALHPPAIRLERAIRDLYGVVPVGLPDDRPWLDLGFWDVQHPLGKRRDAPSSRVPYTSCRPRARISTRSRSVRFMPASSSPGISASPPMARRSCGWKSASATFTRASRA